MQGNATAQMQAYTSRDPHLKEESEQLKLFRKQYKNISFDTLKHRHDNFSFEKTMETRPKIYNSIHWQGIYEHSQNPDIVIFPKLKAEPIFDIQRVGASIATSTHSNLYASGSSFRLQTHNSEDEQNMWSDFKKHFAGKNRQKGNHQEFLINELHKPTTTRQKDRYTLLNPDSVGV